MHVDISEHTPYCRLILRLFLNLLHIACRGTVLALLAAYLHYLSLAFMVAMVVTNLGLASCLLRTDGSKHLWTACAGILLPNAFISRDTVEVLCQEKFINPFLCIIQGYLCNCLVLSYCLVRLWADKRPGSCSADFTK